MSLNLVFKHCLGYDEIHICFHFLSKSLLYSSLCMEFELHMTQIIVQVLCFIYSFQHLHSTWHTVDRITYGINLSDQTLIMFPLVNCWQYILLWHIMGCTNTPFCNFPYITFFAIRLVSWVIVLVKRVRISHSTLNDLA